MHTKLKAFGGNRNIIIFLVSLVPLWFAALVVGKIDDNRIRAIMENQLKTELEVLSLLLHDREHDLIDALESIASDEELRMAMRKGDFSQVQTYLAIQTAANPLAGICIADTQRTVVAFAGREFPACKLPDEERSVAMRLHDGGAFFTYSVPITPMASPPAGYVSGLISLTERAFFASLQEKLSHHFVLWVDGQLAISDLASGVVAKLPNSIRPGRWIDIQASGNRYRAMVQTENCGEGSLAYAVLVSADGLTPNMQLTFLIFGIGIVLILGAMLLLSRFRGTEPIHVRGRSTMVNDGNAHRKSTNTMDRLPRETASRLTCFSMEHAVIGILWIGSDGRLLHANPNAARVLGYTSKELVGMTVFDIDPSVTNDIWQCLWQTLSEGGAETFEAIHRRKDGDEIPVEVCYQRFDDSDQQIAIAFVQDISDRRVAQTEATRLGNALLQAQKMEAIGTLAGGIAHDFNNILSAMIGYAELSLSEVPADAPVHGYQRQILTAGMRARDLVQQILTFSRNDERQLRPIKAAQQLNEALKLLRSSLPATIEIAQHIETNIDPILADPTQIHQIVMNLCTNAAHAMEPDGGCLSVTLSQVRLSENDTALHPGLNAGDYLKLSIQDSGRGMQPETLRKIFDPYFTTKEKGKGTGLGLSVVHGIVKSYGGAIYAYSEPKQGSTFNVYLPSIKTQPTEETWAPADLPGGDEHILLVDDEPALIDVGRTFLEKLGYRVSTAASGDEALELFHRSPHTYDLIVTDMTMPKMTGEKLAAKLLAVRPDLPILLATGYRINGLDAKASKMGVKAFIHKPIVEADLADLVRRVLDESMAAS